MMVIVLRVVVPVLTDICMPSGAIICQAHASCGHSSEGSCRVLTDICKCLLVQ